MRDVINHYPGALFGKFERDRFADTAVAAGNDGNFVLERLVYLFSWL
jgi:hypothetical protein